MLHDDINRSLEITLIMAASCSQQGQQRAQTTRHLAEQLPTSCWMLARSRSRDQELPGSSTAC